MMIGLLLLTVLAWRHRGLCGWSNCRNWAMPMSGH